jgi:hypothetical protein
MKLGSEAFKREWICARMLRHEWFEVVEDKEKMIRHK